MQRKTGLRRFSSSQLARLVRQQFYRLALSRNLVAFYDRFALARSANQSSLGKRGELEAERFFLRQGLIVVARGYSDAFGEIDLILVDGQTLVFAEVKTRSQDFGDSPAEAVDEQKQQRMTRTALGFLKKHRLTECPFRFDIVALQWPASQRWPTLRH